MSEIDSGTAGTGEIPQSEALAEAASDSLLELLSRDPFKFQRQDRDKVIAALREQRVRWEKSELEGASKPKATKVTSNAVQSLLAKKNSGDLGL